MWAFLHVGMLITVMRSPPVSLPPVPMVGVVVVALTAVVMQLDRRIFREALFHANLGISPVWPWAIGLGVAGPLEVLARLLIYPA
jgi:hypothetical protein